MTMDSLRNNQETSFSMELAKPEDWADLKKIRLEAIEKEPMAFHVTTESKEKENKKSDEEWKKELMSESTFIILAKDKNIPIGMAQAILKAQVADQWGVRGVYLNENFRGGGSGEKIIVLIIDEIKKRGGKRVYLNVADTQSVAKKIYEKLGFKTYERFEPEMIDGVGYPGGQWMEREI